MNNNNWLKSIAKTYIQLNENSENPVSQRARDNPNQTDMRGGYPSDVGGLKGIERQMEREGMLSQGVILPEHIKNHGSPFNEDGTINPNHRLVQLSLEKARRKLPGTKWNDPLENFLPHIKITDRIVDGENKGFFISVMENPVGRGT